MFHRVLPDGSSSLARSEREYALSTSAFEACLGFVRDHYNVIDLSDLEGPGLLPSRPLLITFDDGWRDTLIHAAPVLQRFGFPALVFVVPEATSDDRNRWWADAIVKTLGDAGLARRLGAVLGLSDLDSHSFHARAAQLSPDDRWNLPGMDAETPDGLRQMLTEDDLESLPRCRLSLGAHGYTHGPLTCMQDPADEVRRSYAWLQSRGQHAKAMAFPHGAWTLALADTARASGFRFVFNSAPSLTKVPVLKGGENGWPSVIGRIHLPENDWTCDKGAISKPKLATFLFFRAAA
jgi:peptidoglycan/xylan/chitin deacetylase (PgdA/CDA1 family)